MTLMRAGQVAQRFGISRTTLWRWCRSGHFPPAARTRTPNRRLARQHREGMARRAVRLGGRVVTGRVEAPIGAPAQGQLDTVIEQATEAEHTDDMVNHTAEQLLRRAASKILPDFKPTDFGKIHLWQRDVLADNGNARHTLALWAHSVTIRGRRWHRRPLAAVAAVARLGRPRFSELTRT